jgi:hypothetical protein
MSAFPPIATKLQTSLEVRFVPIPEITPLPGWWQQTHILLPPSIPGCARIRRTVFPVETSHAVGPHFQL